MKKKNDFVFIWKKFFWERLVWKKQFEKVSCQINSGRCLNCDGGEFPKVECVVYGCPCTEEQYLKRISTSKLKFKKFDDPEILKSSVKKSKYIRCTVCDTLIKEHLPCQKCENLLNIAIDNIMIEADLPHKKKYIKTKNIALILLLICFLSTSSCNRKIYATSGKHSFKALTNDSVNYQLRNRNNYWGK